MTKWYVLSLLLPLGSLLAGCDRDDDLAADGCRELSVETELPERAPETPAPGFLYAARLSDGCLELAHNCCACRETNAVATRSPLAVYPPIYVVSVEVLEKPGVDCFWAGRDSTRFTLAGIRREDAAFDLRFEGLDDVVIEIR